MCRCYSVYSTETTRSTYLCLTGVYDSALCLFCDFEQLRAAMRLSLYLGSVHVCFYVAMQYMSLHLCLDSSVFLTCTVFLFLKTSQP